MPRRVIKLPLLERVEMEKYFDANNRELERPKLIHTPQYLGIDNEDIDHIEIRQDLRDVAKVVVTARTDVLDDLQARSDDYFRKLWRRKDDLEDD